MSTVTVYTFEDADGTEDTYTTQSAIEAKDRGQRERMRVIANEYEWTDSEMAWDFTPPGDQHEALAMMQGAEPECRRCADHDPRDRRDHGHVPDRLTEPLSPHVYDEPDRGPYCRRCGGSRWGAQHIQGPTDRPE